MLNTVLTVRAGKANSHKGQGWETFTDAVIATINRQCQ
jgi:uracil-DNA glycosylase